jgi:hypothetical protein
MLRNIGETELLSVELRYLKAQIINPFKLFFPLPCPFFKSSVKLYQIIPFFQKKYHEQHMVKS